ncbi:MAG: AMP-binding protein [Gammaproteobacteria bacterium]|nr:AMP-binding protein [Gammaproteobacteria bacterium]
MLLTHILERSTQEFPERTALVMRMGYRTVTLNYREAYELARRIACLLQQHGVMPGDRVIVLAPNSPYWICVFWATLLCGAAIVPLNIQSTARMIADIASHTGAKVIFKYRYLKEALPGGVPVYDIEFIKEDVAGIDAAAFKKVQAAEHDLVEIMYTSGTTGEPKGVMLTHANLYSNVTAIAAGIPLTPQDRLLSILPLSHILEQTAGFLLPFSAGARIVFTPTPAAIAGLLPQHRITKMVAVPEFLKVMMSKIEERAAARGFPLAALRNLAQRLPLKSLQRLLFFPVHRTFGGRLETIACGGAPLDVALEKKWEALGITLLQGYGLTETSPVVTNNTRKHHRSGSVGRVLPGVAVKIADDGEILVKGLNVFSGYFNDEQKTRAVFDAEGWFHTGDIGAVDQDGFLFIKGRKKYVIMGPGAQNVYPEDIECELNKIAGVKDSCVVGLDRPGGQVDIHAVLLLDAAVPEAPQAADIIAAVNQHLASYQRITSGSLWPLDDFPRSATHKIKREPVLAHLITHVTDGEKAAPGGEKTILMRLLASLTGQPLARINDATQLVADLNLDSLLRIELVMRLEETFGVAIDETAITHTTTVAQLEVMTRAGTAPRAKQRFKSWLLTRWASWLRAALQSLLVFPLMRSFMKLKVEGREHLDAIPLPAVFMPNHVSYLDSMALAMALPRRIRKRLAFAAAQDVVYGEFKSVAWLIEFAFNTFPFPRHEHEHIQHGLDYAGRLLDRGWCVVVYPEGKMSETGALLPLQRGAGLIAVEADVCVVPLKISGTNAIVPCGKIMPRRRGVVTVRFGTPVKFSRRDSIADVTNRLQAVMREM